VGNPANNGFDAKAFLAKVGAGKTILKFEKNQHVFRQGDKVGAPTDCDKADAVFYIQKGSVKLQALSSLSDPSKARKRSSGFWNRAQFFGEGCLNGHPLRIDDHNGGGRTRDTHRPGLLAKKSLSTVNWPILV
jgi:CRP/FNR family cyclic AMP-dependent transcriptional regulator